MELKKHLRKSFIKLTLILFLIQTASCGYIIYPERKGQTTGQIDPGVAILDAILFIPGILPGVIAFAVDFVTGAIYLPGGGTDTHDTLGDKNQVEAARAAKRMDIRALETILSRNTGKEVHLKASDIHVLKVNDRDYIDRYFIRADRKTVQSLQARG